MPHQATLSNLPVSLFAPNALPGLWKSDRLTLDAARRYFSGSHTVTVPREGWDEHIAIPGCAEETLQEALACAVAAGTVWLVSGPTSCWKEEVPASVLRGEGELLPAPALVAPQELTSEALPDAWKNGETSAAAIVRALSQKQGSAVPWGLVRDSLGDAVRSRWLETAGGDGPATEYEAAGTWLLRKPEEGAPATPEPEVADWEMDATQVQNLADVVPKLLETSAGFDLRFRIGVALDAGAPKSVRREVDDLLAQALGSTSGS